MNELEREIRNEIARTGPLSFRRFMELALYHPQWGYYRRARDPFGFAGDYFTNSQLQPVFGRLIARQIAAWREQLGSPPDFTVVELGAGRGETAAEVRACLPQVRYIEVEHGTGALPPRITGVIFSNEFFDALPVEVACFNGDQWTERCVGLNQDRLAWVESKLSSAQLEDYLRRYCPRPPPGQIIEANLTALGWLDRIARSLERGFVLTVDYGYTASEISEGRRFPQGSLMSYYRHSAIEDVLASPGEHDITAHLAFTALADHGETLCLHARPLQTQAQFLLSIGQSDNFESALTATSEEEAQRHRTLLKTLLFGMGETFQVLVQEGNVDRGS